jgi:hypothetical protein
VSVRGAAILFAVAVVSLLLGMLISGGVDWNA